MGHQAMPHGGSSWGGRGPPAALEVLTKQRSPLVAARRAWTAGGRGGGEPVAEAVPMDDDENDPRSDKGGITILVILVILVILFIIVVVVRLVIYIVQ